MWFKPNKVVVPNQLLVGIETADYDLSGECGFTLSLMVWLAFCGPRPTYIKLVSAGHVIAEQATSIRRPDVTAHLNSLKPIPRHAQYDPVGFQILCSKLMLADTSSCEIWLGYNVSTGVTETLVGHVGGFEPKPPLNGSSRFSPILITAMGRSGTTLLAGALSAHKQIIGAGGYPFENRWATHLWHAAYVASSPGNYELSVRPDDFERDTPHVTGYNPFNTRLFVKGLSALDIREWINHTYVISNLEHARNNIDRFYDHIAAAQSKPTARYFTEKTSGSWVTEIARHVHSDAREIFLVRDFRDAAISAHHFWREAGASSIGDLLKGSDHSWFHSRVAESEKLSRAYLDRSKRCIVVHYEHLVNDQDATLRKIADFIGIECDAEFLSAAQSTVASGITGGIRHRTSESPKSSIGRWRKELQAEERGFLTELFAMPLRTFGYLPPFTE